MENDLQVEAKVANEQYQALLATLSGRMDYHASSIRIVGRSWCLWTMAAPSGFLFRLGNILSFGKVHSSRAGGTGYDGADRRGATACISHSLSARSRALEPAD